MDEGVETDLQAMKEKAQKQLRDKQKQAEEEIANSEYARHEVALQEKKYRREIGALREHLMEQIFEIKVRLRFIKERCFEGCPRAKEC